MTEIMDLIIRAIITAFAGTFAGAVFFWVKDAHKKEKLFEAAVKALAHDSFHRQCRELLGQESITEDELENLNYLYGAYKSLGLNGTGEELYKRCLGKPIE